MNQTEDVIKLFKLINELTVSKPKNIPSFDLPISFRRKKKTGFLRYRYRGLVYRNRSTRISSIPGVDADKLRNQCVEIFYFLVNKKESNSEEQELSSIPTLRDIFFRSKYRLSKQNTSIEISDSIDKISKHPGVFGLIILKHSIQIAKEFSQLSPYSLLKFENILRSKEDEVNQRNCIKFISEEEKKLMIKNKYEEYEAYQIM